MFVMAMALTVFSNVLYHLFLKVTPNQSHPLVSLAVTYLVAAILCVLLLPLFPLEDRIGVELRQLNWASYALGAVVVGLEIGFLLAYRAGWRISTGALVSNLTVSMLLLPVGLLFFSEKMSLTNSIGAVIALLGLALVNWK